MWLIFLLSALVQGEILLGKFKVNPSILEEMPLLLNSE